MNTSRLKTAAIVLLALVNLVLVASLLLSGAFSSDMTLSEQKEIREFLNQRGIAFNEELFRLRLPVFYEMYSERDYINELTIMKMLLGDVDAEAEGGGIMRYTSPLGTAVIRSGGRTEMVIFEDIPAFHNLRSSENVVRALFGRMGLSSARYDVRYLGKTSGVNDTGSVIVSQRLGGLPVFNAELLLESSVSGSYTISGRFITNPAVMTTRVAARSSSALIAGFVLETQKQNLGVSSISGVQYGYILLTSAGDRSILRPVLSFVTDSGLFYTDAITGKLLLAEG